MSATKNKIHINIKYTKLGDFGTILLIFDKFDLQFWWLVRLLLLFDKIFAYFTTYGCIRNVQKCNKMASFAQLISFTVVLSRMTNFVQKALLFIVCVGLVWHYFDAGLVRPRPILFSNLPLA